MLNIVLLGPPGAGKGTQSKKLASGYDLLHISPGDLFRSAIEQNFSLGKEVKAYVNAGKLVPNQIVIDLIQKTLQKKYKSGVGLLFDGYPRSLEQAVALNKQLEHYDTLLDLAFLLDVGSEEIHKRIKLRSKIEKRADDQDLKKIAHRLVNYQNKTTPIFDYYQEEKKSHKIPGEGSIEEVYQKITHIIHQYKNNC